MKLSIKLISLILLLSTSSLWAETSDFIKRAVVTSAVESREPIDNLDTVNGLDKVYFYTEVTNSANTMITHRWFLNGKLEAEVVLKIGSDRWRPYLSKNLFYPAHIAYCHVEAVDNINQVIGSAFFSVSN